MGWEVIMADAQQAPVVGAMPGTTNRRWSFGPVVLDERTLELRVDGRLVEIERKPLEVLICLLQRPDEVVTKDQLLAAVWPGRILSDTALTRCIFKLREALGDQQQEIVKTLHGIGYRFVAPVRVEPSVTGATGPPAAEAPATKRRKWLSTAAGLAAAIAAAIAWFLLAPPRAGDKSVAVLPFTNLSADAGNQFFSDGLHDSVITQLARIQDLLVVSRASVLPYRQEGRNLKRIASELGVATILEGSVQRSGDRIRVQAQLINAKTDTHLWAAQYDRDASDVFAVQSDIALKVADAVSARLLPEVRARIVRVPTSSLEAYELYVRARATWDNLNNASWQTDMAKAVELLDQAIARDAQFALAYALRSRFHTATYWLGLDTAEQRRALARDAAETALRLDPDLAEGHEALGYYFLRAGRDGAAALHELETARTLAPGSASILTTLAKAYDAADRRQDAIRALDAALRLEPRSVETLRYQATLLMRQWRYEEAGKILDRAVALSGDALFLKQSRAMARFGQTGDYAVVDALYRDLPPEPCAELQWKWNTHFYSRRFDEAAAVMLACPDATVPWEGGLRMPMDIFVAISYRFAGKTEQARDYFQRSREKFAKLVGEAPRNALFRTALALSLAGLGQRDEAKAEVDRALAMLPASAAPDLMWYTAYVRLETGDYDSALSEIEQNISSGRADGPLLQVNPFWDPVRGDPRFTKLIARMRHPAQ